MNKLSNKIKSDQIIELILGLLVSFAGAIVFFTKLSGTRYGGVIEGISAQLIGIILIIYGLYKIVSALKKIYSKHN